MRKGKSSRIAIPAFDIFREVAEPAVLSLTTHGSFRKLHFHSQDFRDGSSELARASRGNDHHLSATHQETTSAPEAALVYHIILHSIMLHYVMLYYVILYYTITHYVIL